MGKAKANLALGLDSSTQSLTAVVIDFEKGETVYEHSLDYAADERLRCFGIDQSEYLVPPRVPGEADQPPLMFLASLDAVFGDLRASGVPLAELAVVNVSGQQHGHVYLGSDAAEAFTALRDPRSAEGSLVDLLRKCFAYGTAPIWRTSNTEPQAEAIRTGVGGKGRMVELSGSDSPLRFTGAVVRRVGEQFPAAYEATETLQLISSFLPAVLTGSHRVPMDFGNASGTSLMDYVNRSWSDDLIAAAAAGLPGGAAAMHRKLPPLVKPNSIVGPVAGYFTRKYGIAPSCVVAAGSGDNPQTKVLISGDLLSLGTSFVFMVSTDGRVVDKEGYANAMYDGVGRPFMFGCRTNGAMVWDRVRSQHGLGKKEYDKAEAALGATPPGSSLFLWQPENESFPVSPSFDMLRIDYAKPDLAKDYSGIIDSTLAAVYWYSRHFSRAADPAGSRGVGASNEDTGSKDSTAGESPLYVTGGATGSAQIMRRVSALWRRPVVAIGRIGAALGAAVAGVSALRGAGGAPEKLDELIESLLPHSKPLLPSRDDEAAYHRDGGYLARFAAAYDQYRR